MALYLIGDAILDNFYWLDDKEHDLTREMSDLGHQVHNYAIDDIRLNDIINGIVPSNTYTSTRSYNYQVNKNNKLYPLKELSSKINKNKSFKSVYGEVGIRPIGSKAEDDNMVIISIGGNDINDHFAKILLGVNYFIEAVITKEFISNYQKVIETSRSSCMKILLISIYLPYIGPGSSYGKYSAFATPIIRNWNIFLHKMARKYNIPILDLNRTFDTNNRSHYGTIDTRPSNISNKCMAACISYIHKNYDGYRTYYAPKCDISKIITE